MPWFLSWDLFAGCGERVIITRSVFEDTILMFVLMKYFASLNVFHNVSCFPLLKSCHRRKRFFVVFCNEVLISDSVFAYCHFTIMSQWFLCFFGLRSVFHALLLCTLDDSIWSCNRDIVQDSGLQVMHRWTTNSPWNCKRRVADFQHWAVTQELLESVPESLHQ